MSEVTISLKNLDEERALFGHLDRNLRILRTSYDVDAISRGGLLTLRGSPDRLEAAAETVQRALELIRDDGVGAAEVADVFRGEPVGTDAAGVRRVKLTVSPRSPNQQRYVEAMQETPVTFGVGPAGSGKTYLAVAVAVALVRAGAFRKIVLVRPAVEAGENLGFLPGDLEAKIKPYLRPLYDALDDLLPKGTLKRYMDEGVVEISPLAYMRGRTLNHSVIILDEAQNTTAAQMKMCLTRLGANGKIVVTGDVSQVDLPRDQESGLLHALRVLRKVEGVSFCRMTREDIVRHDVVQRIVQAYGSWEERVKQDAARAEGAPRPARDEKGGRGRKGKR